VSGDRTWAMTLDIACSIETCPKIDTASCADTCATGATENVKKILRYRGWKIDRRSNTCPDHSGPIPPCPTCGTPTPTIYGFNNGAYWRLPGQAVNTCEPCYRKQFALNMAARLMEDGATP
jgi:hypothetical protein